MKRIFLISGFGQAGKDTTANFLKRKLIGRTLILHNADVLKYRMVEINMANRVKNFLSIIFMVVGIITISIGIYDIFLGNLFGFLMIIVGFWCFLGNFKVFFDDKR